MRFTHLIQFLQHEIYTSDAVPTTGDPHIRYSSYNMRYAHQIQFLQHEIYTSDAVPTT